MASESSKLDEAFASIDQAIHEQNIDDALSKVQKIAGIETGDVAGLFFSDFDNPYEAWSEADTLARRNILKDYLTIEAQYI